MASKSLKSSPKQFYLMIFPNLKYYWSPISLNQDFRKVLFMRQIFIAEYHLRFSDTECSLCLNKRNIFLSPLENKDKVLPVQLTTYTQEDSAINNPHVKCVGSK